MLVDGINVVRELLKASVKVEKIVAIDGDNAEIIAIIDKARAMGVSVNVLDKKDFDRKFNFKNQGIVAYISEFKYCVINTI